MTKTKLKDAMLTIQTQCKELDEIYFGVDKEDIYITYKDYSAYKCKLQDVDNILDSLKFLSGFEYD